MLSSFVTPYKGHIVKRRRTFFFPEDLVFTVYKSKYRSLFSDSYGYVLKILLVLMNLSTLLGYLDDYGSISLPMLYFYWKANWLMLYSYTSNPLKCFDLVALHHSQLDWLHNRNDFLLNCCAMALPIFLVYQHKERLCKYREQRHIIQWLQ